MTPTRGADDRRWGIHATLGATGRGCRRRRTGEGPLRRGEPARGRTVSSPTHDGVLLTFLATAVTSTLQSLPSHTLAIALDKSRRDRPFGCRRLHVMGLTSGEFPGSEIPQALEQGVNLGLQPTARVPKRLIAPFFGAPAACWWACTTPASSKTCSKSAPPTSTSNTRYVQLRC